LPHWQQKGAVYFITFRLVDSIPTRLRRQLEDERVAWLRFHPEPWDIETELEYHKRFTSAIERWLDAGYGRAFCGKASARKLSIMRCAISMGSVLRSSRQSLCRTTFTRSWFRILNIPWKICFEAGRHLVRGQSIDYVRSRAPYGSEVILIASCEMRNISGTAFVTSGITQRKRV
jgi:hypothetical protein